MSEKRTLPVLSPAEQEARGLAFLLAKNVSLGQATAVTRALHPHLTEEVAVIATKLVATILSGLPRYELASVAQHLANEYGAYPWSGPVGNGLKLSEYRASFKAQAAEYLHFVRELRLTEDVVWWETVTPPAAPLKAGDLVRERDTDRLLVLVDVNENPAYEEDSENWGTAQSVSGNKFFYLATPNSVDLVLRAEEITGGSVPTGPQLRELLSRSLRLASDRDTSVDEVTATSDGGLRLYGRTSTGQTFTVKLEITNVGAVSN